MVIMNSNESAAISQVTLNDLLAETGQYLAPQDMERIQRAFLVADEAHRGVARRSGEPYIQHPLEVALLLADMRIDADGIVAALLHDVVEDTDFTLEELRAQFGEAVATIVDGVTKFDTLAGKNVGGQFLAQDGVDGFDPSPRETPEQIEQRQRVARDL